MRDFLKTGLFLFSIFIIIGIAGYIENGGGLVWMLATVPEIITAVIITADNIRTEKKEK